MVYEMDTVCNANTEHWRKRMENMRIVYGIEKIVFGGSKSAGPSEDIGSEPGHKERFEGLLKEAVKSKK
jgi:hypothetical protein